MQSTMRTTIRIRKDLLDQSRMLALNKGTSLQDIINNALTVGFQHITDLNSSHESMKEIDKFRQSMLRKRIDVKKLLKASKSEQK